MFSNNQQSRGISFFGLIIWVVIIWNDIDTIIKSLGFQNPVSRSAQIENGWRGPGEVGAAS